MTATMLSPNAIVDDPDAWDERLHQLGGHLLQSWRWGEFKAKYGWSAERITSPESGALAQVLYRSKGPVSVAYVPRGPAFGNDEQELSAIFARISEVSGKRRALYAIVELDKQAPPGFFDDQPAWMTGPAYIQPGRTVKIELADDETMLKGMHQKTRYSVRLAMRKGVEIDAFEGLCEDGLQMFYQLLVETSSRNEFGVHGEDYYRDFLATFGRDALLLIARVQGQPAAGLIAAAFGDEAIYMYGGSSTQHRAQGAAFLLQFEAMRWARNRGLKRYDLWGIPHQDPEPPAEALDAVPATKGDDWRGLYRFKTGFGGTIVDYPAPIERQFHRLASRLAKQYIRGVG